MIMYHVHVLLLVRARCTLMSIYTVSSTPCEYSQESKTQHVLRTNVYKVPRTPHVQRRATVDYSSMKSVPLDMKTGSFDPRQLVSNQLS